MPRILVASSPVEIDAKADAAELPPEALGVARQMFHELTDRLGKAVIALEVQHKEWPEHRFYFGTDGSEPSGKAQLLEAKADVDRRLALIPLTDGERADVEQDQQALGKLLGSLADTPTPAGPMPREIAGQSSVSTCQPYST